MTENNEAEGGPMQTVLNVRMDSTLKERGDKVLSENGISVSAAVRALWAELAKTRTVPEFLQRREEGEQHKRERRDALEALSRIGCTVPSEKLTVDDKALRDAMYAEMRSEYKALS